MNMTGVKLKEKSSFGSLALKILGFIAQLTERPAVNRKAAGSMSPFHSGRRRTDVPRTSCDLLFPLKKRFQWSFVQWQGSCLMRSLCTIRRIVFDIPQLRSCFSGAMEAQLFRNQQAVGSMSAC